MKTPTHSFYRYLEAAYDHFNAALFAGRLPTCLLTVQREKNLMGVDLHLKQTRDLHLKLTRLIGRIMA